MAKELKQIEGPELKDIVLPILNRLRASVHLMPAKTWLWSRKEIEALGVVIDAVEDSVRDNVSDR